MPGLYGPRREDSVMKNNTIVIGNEKKDNIESRTTAQEAFQAGLNLSAAVARETVQEPVHEKDWGNDPLVLNSLEGKMLADRRLYTRALYIQKIMCNTVLDGRGTEPSRLRDRMEFTVIDISMGGIGIVCEYEILTGTILLFKIVLDNIPYDIKGEVAYCFRNDGKYRAGLRVIDRDRSFIRHLKILVARLSLQSKYGKRT
jgi:hypothetical protein